MTEEEIVYRLRNRVIYKSSYIKRKYTSKRKTIPLETLQEAYQVVYWYLPYLPEEWKLEVSSHTFLKIKYLDELTFKMYHMKDMILQTINGLLELQFKEDIIENYAYNCNLYYNRLHQLKLITALLEYLKLYIPPQNANEYIELDNMLQYFLSLQQMDC